MEKKFTVQQVGAVYYDFDGTVVDSIGDIYRGVCNVFRMSGCSIPTFTEFCEAFETPYMRYYEKMGVPASQKQVEEWYYVVVDRSKKAPWFVDVREVLSCVSEMGLKQGIISANDSGHVSGCCAAHGIGLHLETIVGSAHDKVEALKNVCVSFSIQPQNVYYVGDFVSNMRDARKAGVVPVGITRGRKTEKVLKDHGEEFCIDSLSELPKVLLKHAKVA